MKKNLGGCDDASLIYETPNSSSLCSKMSISRPENSVLAPSSQDLHGLTYN